MNRYIFILSDRRSATKHKENTSYFAFTATPKSKTREMFGEWNLKADGITKILPFYGYKVKQAVQRAIILNVLALLYAGQ